MRPIGRFVSGQRTSGQRPHRRRRSKLPDGGPVDAVAGAVDHRGLTRAMGVDRRPLFRHHADVSDEQVARFNVLLENIQTGVKAISEGHGELVNRLDRLESKVDGIASDVATLKGDVHTLKRDMVGVKGRLDHVDGRLDHVDGRLDRIDHHLGLNGAPAKKRPAKQPPTRKK